MSLEIQCVLILRDCFSSPQERIGTVDIHPIPRFGEG